MRRYLAWSLWVAFVAAQALSFWLIASSSATGDQAFSVVGIGFATVGALVASRRPENRVGWLLLATSLAFGLQTLGEVYSSVPSAPAYVAVSWVAAWAWYVWMLLAAVFLPLVFPNGRLLSRRWRPAMWLGCAALAASIVGEAFRPGDLDLEHAQGVRPVQNPLGVSGWLADLVAIAGPLGSALSAGAFVLAAASLVVRFRRARESERQQLKWFAFFGLLTLGGLALAIVAVLFPGDLSDPIGAVGWFTFLFGSLIGVPVATGIAILRHRLYDIDLVIKRTLVYGVLTALLVATYLSLVLLFRIVLSPLTGDSDLAVAGSTLAVAALFRPLRSRTQSVVDRRFYRSRYDAARTLEAFSGRLRDELDLETLASDVRSVARDTLQPAHVSLWLRNPS